MTQKFIYGIFASLAITVFATGILYAPINSLRAAPRSTLMSGQTIKLPAVPGLKANQSGAVVVLAWGKPAKGLAFTGYAVFRSEKSGRLGSEIGRLAKNKLAFTDAKALSAPTYYYSVKYLGKNALGVDGRQVKISLAKREAAVSGSPAETAAGESSIVSKAPEASASPVSGQNPKSALSTEQPNIFSNPNPTVAPVKDAAASPKDSERVTTLKQLQVALNQYRAAEEAYPPGTGIVLGQTNTSCLNSDAWQNSDDCPYPYFGTIPKDPGASAYVYTAVGDSYKVEVTLDGKVEGLSGSVILTPEGIRKK